MNSQAQWRFRDFSRVHESSEVQAALEFLGKAQQSPDGLLTLIAQMESQELLPASQQPLYVRTHPMARDRIDATWAETGAAMRGVVTGREPNAASKASA